MQQTHNKGSSFASIMSSTTGFSSTTLVNTAKMAIEKAAAGNTSHCLQTTIGQSWIANS